MAMNAFLGARKVLRFVGFASFGLVAVSVASSSVLRLALKASEKRRRRTAPKCTVCKGECTLPCRVCRTSGVVDWSPLADPVLKRPVVCPTCDGSKMQKCLNCVGKGFV